MTSKIIEKLQKEALDKDKGKFKVGDNVKVASWIGVDIFLVWKETSLTNSWPQTLYQCTFDHIEQSKIDL